MRELRCATAALSSARRSLSCCSCTMSTSHQIHVARQHSRFQPMNGPLLPEKERFYLTRDRLGEKLTHRPRSVFPSLRMSQGPCSDEQPDGQSLSPHTGLDNFLSRRLISGKTLSATIQHKLFFFSKKGQKHVLVAPDKCTSNTK